MQKKQQFTAFFRVKGLYPWWVDALSGEIRPLPEYTEVDGGTSLPLELDAWGSGFVFWDTKDHGAKGKNVRTWTPIEDLSEGWKASFFSRVDSATFSIDYKSLVDWKDKEETKYFSGKALYSKTFHSEEAQELYLDLGPVMMAKVKLNGDEVGGVWAPPYRLKIGVKRGENHLVVEVVNTWNNALVGDKDKRLWAPVKRLNAASPLQSGGLLGPVQLLKQND